jgi:hypothetical protein
VGRRGIVAASVVALGVLLWPALDPAATDSLPVSSYPMFARPKARVSSFPLAVMRDESGREQRLGARAIGGTDQPMQAAMTINQAVREGTADQLCAEIAAGLAEPGTIEIVTAVYDAVGWYEGNREPIDHHVHARCSSEDVP